MIARSVVKSCTSIGSIPKAKRNTSSQGLSFDNKASTLDPTTGSFVTMLADLSTSIPIETGGRPFSARKYAMGIGRSSSVATKSDCVRPTVGAPVESMTSTENST